MSAKNKVEEVEDETVSGEDMTIRYENLVGTNGIKSEKADCAH